MKIATSFPFRRTCEELVRKAVFFRIRWNFSTIKRKLKITGIRHTGQAEPSLFGRHLHDFFEVGEEGRGIIHELDYWQFYSNTSRSLRKDPRKMRSKREKCVQKTKLFALTPSQLFLMRRMACLVSYMGNFTWICGFFTRFHSPSLIERWMAEPSSSLRGITSPRYWKTNIPSSRKSNLQYGESYKKEGHNIHFLLLWTLC